MPSPFTQAGAQGEPSSSAPLHTNRFFTGLWTQRSQLRDAATPFLYEKFYSASRFDSLIGGLNSEVTTRLTLARRPGSSIYNPGPFAPILRFYAFRTFVGGQELIKIIADCGADVREVTGLATNTVLWTKLPGAMTSSFLSIGNSLFWSDGVNQKKWVLPSKVWKAVTAYNPGDFILDPNGNVQQAQAIPAVGTISKIQIVSVPSGTTGVFDRIVLVTFSGAQPWFANAPVTFSGLTAYTTLNGVSLSAAPGLRSYPGQYAFAYGRAPGPIYPAVYANTADTGTVTGAPATPVSGTGRGVLPPFTPMTWNLVIGGATVDGTVVWVNFGTPVWDWQMAAPPTAPVVSVSGGNVWQPRLYLGGVNGPAYPILDSNGAVQTVQSWTGAAMTGATQPNWNKALGGQTVDGTVVWVNNGQIRSWTASTLEAAWSCVLDSAQNLQVCISSGTSGGAAPIWNLAVGNNTTDGAVTWHNAGPASMLATAPFNYAYSFHGIDGSVTTASPLATVPNGILGAAGSFNVGLAGVNTIDPQCDEIWIWRTAQGGSTLLYLDSVSNPAIGTLANWTYTDTIPDSALNLFLQAPIAHAGDPPPAGLTALEFHTGHIWGFVANQLVYSGGPDTLSGNGNTAWPPLNEFAYPANGVRVWPTSIGLILFTISDIHLVPGQGTAQSPFYSIPFQPGVGLLSWDAVGINGSTAYLMTPARRLISIDPGAGEVEIGFPIGDQFKNYYDPAKTFMTWHEGSSDDTALYVADGTASWYRMGAISAPEAGNVWCPKATFAGGMGCVKSIEVSPGQKRLLMGPSGAPGPILQRDDTTNTDAGTPFPAHTDIGSILLAQSGQIALVEHITCDSIKVGSPVNLGILLGEISGTFEPLPYLRQDPTLLPPAKTLYASRYYLMQNQQPIACRHLQVRVAWPAEDAHNELLAYTIYGEIRNEK